MWRYTWILLGRRNVKIHSFIADTLDLAVNGADYILKNLLLWPSTSHLR